MITKVESRILIPTLVALLFQIAFCTPARGQIQLNCPTNQSLSTCSTGAMLTYLISATSSCPGCVTISCLPTNGSFLPIGTNVIACSASDACGAVTNCNFPVVVQLDTTPPLLLCATNRSVECGAAWAFDLPRAVDACDGTNVVIRVVSTVTNLGGCPVKFLATRTWQAIDSQSNSVFCSQTVSVVDTARPVFVCGRNQSVECGVPWNFTLPVAVDNCDGTNITIQIFSTITNFLCGRTYSATRLWRAIDACGSNTTCFQTITVVDTMPPVMTCVAIKTVECGAAWTFDRPSAYDLCDRTNVSVVIVGTVTNTVGFCGRNFSTTRTWRATDTCSTSNSVCSQTVTVVDTTPPMIYCPPTLVAISPGTNGIPVTFNPAVSDFCNGTNLAVVCQPASASVFPVGTSHVICHAIDPCNNTNQCTFEVIVLPPPQLNVALVQTINTASLTWPDLYNNYLPQSTATVDDPNGWQFLTNKPMIIGGQAKVELPSSNGPAFFRLKRLP